ncbi:MAG: tetratricopeptide repeat protein [Bacteroidetes bacterium]|nr:tetratricopeptide repeat protein [Bacteroidota bacterium]
MPAQEGADQFRQAEELRIAGKFKKAIPVYEEAIKLDYYNIEYHVGKGICQLKLSEPAEAFLTFSLANSIDSREWKPYYYRGRIYTQSGKPDKAIIDFSAALQYATVDSQRVDVLFERGSAHMSLRDYKSAYADLSEALKLDSTNVLVLNNLAMASDEADKGDETLGYLFRILEIDSAFFGAWMNIGFKYQLMGDYVKSIEALDKALELSKDEPFALNNRGYSKYKAGDLKGGLKDIGRSIKVMPDNSYAFRNRALIYIQMGETEDACKDISKALELGFTRQYGSEIQDLKRRYCK